MKLCEAALEESEWEAWDEMSKKAPPSKKHGKGKETKHES